MKQIWTGSISFWLIHIPVKLYSATKDSRINFDLLRKGDLCPVGYARVCKSTGEEVPYDQIVKGYEYEKGDYIVLTDEDFKKASPKKTEAIDIVQFVNAEEVDAMLLEKPYYLEPTKTAQKVYALLREALKKSGKAGLCRFVLRSSEHLGIIRPKEDLLVLEQMRFQEEIRDPSELNVPEKAEFSQKELDMTIQFIDELTAPFKSEEYHDTYSQELMKFIEEKRQWKEHEAKEKKAPKMAETTDIMAQLKKSLELAKSGK